MQTLWPALRFLLPLVAIVAAGCGGGAGAGSASRATMPVVSSAQSTGQVDELRKSSVASPTPAASTASSSGTTATTTQTSSSAGCGDAPYSCSSPFNRRVSSNPQFASYSADAIAMQFRNGNTQPVRSSESGQYDYGHPIFYATSSDPVVTLACNKWCNRSDNGGLPSQIHIPASARAAGGDDAHLAVVQPDGTEIDVFGASRPSGNWGSGGNTTLSGSAMANCGSYTAGSGVVPSGPAATAGGSCLAAGLLRAAELLSGSINHALFLVSECAVGWQYPAFPNATTGTCSSGVGAPLGGRIWYDVDEATTNANPALKPWEKVILVALHRYGAYLMDNISGGAYQSGIAFLAESGEAARDLGLPDPFAGLAAQGWWSVSVGGATENRYVGADPWRPAGVDFAAHMHWLAPCSAQGSC
jgi:hypothetical protein